MSKVKTIRYVFHGETEEQESQVYIGSPDFASKEFEDHEIFYYFESEEELKQATRQGNDFEFQVINYEG